MSNGTKRTGHKQEPMTMGSCHKTCDDHGCISEGKSPGNEVAVLVSNELGVRFYLRSVSKRLP